MNKIKKYFYNAGLEEERFKHIYPEVLQRNTIYLYTFSIGMTIYYSAYTIYAIILSGWHALYGFYCADIVTMLLLAIVCKIVARKKRR